MLGPAVSAVSLALLGASGVAKIIDPTPTSGALKRARLPSSAFISRSIGVGEMTAATVGLVLGGMTLVAAALFYGVFTLFTLAALRGRIPLRSCGCFGRDDTPPSKIHVVYNAVATVALTWLAFSQQTPVSWESGPVDLTLFLLFAGLGAFASYLLLARLPLTLKAGS